MPKYRTTICQDQGFSKGMLFIAPIDLRKKYYKCNHCQKEHLVKEGVVKEIDKKSVHYFMTEMSQQEFNELNKNHEKSPYTFNMLRKSVTPPSVRE